MVINSFDFGTYHVRGLKNELADGLSRFTVELIKTDKFTQTNKYALELTAIESDDTMTPFLTSQQRKDLELIMKETEYLTDKYDKLKHSKVHRNAIIMSINDDTCYCEPSDTTLNKSNKMSEFNYQNNVNYIYTENIDKEFNRVVEYFFL